MSHLNKNPKKSNKIDRNRNRRWKRRFSDSPGLNTMPPGWKSDPERIGSERIAGLFGHLACPRIENLAKNVPCFPLARRIFLGHSNRVCGTKTNEKFFVCRLEICRQ